MVSAALVIVTASCGGEATSSQTDGSNRSHTTSTTLSVVDPTPVVAAPPSTGESVPPGDSMDELEAPTRHAVVDCVDWWLSLRADIDLGPNRVREKWRLCQDALNLLEQDSSRHTADIVALLLHAEGSIATATVNQTEADSTGVAAQIEQLLAYRSEILALL